MAFLGIVYILAVPFLWGNVVFLLSRNRREKVEPVVKYTAGLLALLSFFLFCLLIALKMDSSLKELEKLFLGGSMLVALMGVAIAIKRRDILKRIMGRKAFLSILPSVIVAFILFVFSYIYLSPSIVNDDTWDVVAVTLANGSVYTHSAMTGQKLVNGLPIFNKIYIIPMLISCFCDCFKFEPSFVLKYGMPALLFLINLALVKTIASEVKVKNTNAFMLIYLILLIVGTYLPSKGIPVTLGYELLRQGYTGYAIAYGLLAPFVVLMLIRGQYYIATISGVSLLGLIRLDRIYYAVRDPINSYMDVVKSGKMFALYLLAVFAMIIWVRKKNQEAHINLLFLPSVFIAYEAEYIGGQLVERREKVIYYFALSVLLYSVCSFSIFSDAEFSSSVRDKEIAATEINMIINDSDSIVWGSTEMMGYLHRTDGNRKTLYGRNVNVLTMDGLDYEDKPEDFEILYLGYYNLVDRKTFYDTETPIETLLKKISKLCDYIVLPSDNLNDNLQAQLSEAKYSYIAENSGYFIYRTSKND